MMRSSIPILPTSWRSAESRVLRTSSAGSPISLRDRRRVARDALGVAARVRVLRVDRRRQRADRGDEELLVLARRLLDLLERVADRLAHAVEVLGEVRDLRRAGHLDARAVLALRSRRASTRRAARSAARAAARRGDPGAARPRGRRRSRGSCPGPSGPPRRTPGSGRVRRARPRAARPPARSTRERCPIGVDSERVRRAGNRTKSATRVEERCVPPLPRSPEERGSRPVRSTSVARTSRRASSWNSRTMGCQEPSASTTPIRCPFPSVDGGREHGDDSDPGNAEGLSGVADAVPRRLEALAELEVHLRGVQVGTHEAARALRGSRPAARRGRSGPGGRRPGSRPLRPMPKGSFPVSCTARRMASAALVSCCPAAP